MISTGTITRGTSFVLLLSAVLAGSTWFLFLQRPPVPPDAGGEIAALTAEREQLRGNEDGVREQLRQQQAAISRHAWTAESLATLQAELGEGWRWEWSTDGRAIVHCERPRFEGWPGYVALVSALGQKPGVIVEAVEVRAEGPARSRRFAQVAIGLRFILDGAPVRDGARAGPSPGPPPVAAAEGPDPARKVGAGPALRPASASSRPDPPGPPAGVQPTIPPINPNLP